MFQWIFGKTLTPQEQLRQNQRQLERTQRELEREKAKLATQEKKLLSDIKKSAKQGQNSAVKIQARDLIRTRKQMVKFDKMKTQMQAISLRLATIRSSHQMTQSMSQATKVLNGLNGTGLNLSQLGKIASDFQRSMDMMDQKQEMVDDMMDDLMDDELDEEDEEEIDEVVNQVLDEVGINLNNKLGDVNVASGEMEQQQETSRVALPMGASGGADDDLEARLSSLKKS